MQKQLLKHIINLSVAISCLSFLPGTSLTHNLISPLGVTIDKPVKALLEDIDIEDDMSKLSPQSDLETGMDEEM